MFLVINTKLETWQNYPIIDSSSNNNIDLKN